VFKSFSDLARFEAFQTLFPADSTRYRRIQELMLNEARVLFPRMIPSNEALLMSMLRYLVNDPDSVVDRSFIYIQGKGKIMSRFLLTESDMKQIRMEKYSKGDHYSLPQVLEQVIIKYGTFENMEAKKKQRESGKLGKNRLYKENGERLIAALEARGYRYNGDFFGSDIDLKSVHFDLNDAVEKAIFHLEETFRLFFRVGRYRLIYDRTTPEKYMELVKRFSQAE
jgi:hypothetical protein